MKILSASSRSVGFALLVLGCAAFGACTSSSGAGGTAGASATAGANGSAGSGGASGAGTAGSGSAGASGDAAAGTSGQAGTPGTDGGAGKPATNSCGVTSNLGATIVTQSAAQGDGDRPTSTPQGSLQWLAQLDNDNEPNELDVQLYENMMPFGASLAPMTISLASQGSFATCGACVVFHPMYVTGAPIHSQISYIATGGTLTLTAVPSAAAPMLTGTLTNVTFAHVDIDLTTYATTPDPDGCTVTLPSATINVPAVTLIP
jgi:hypothetical protein